MARRQDRQHPWIRVILSRDPRDPPSKNVPVSTISRKKMAARVEYALRLDGKKMDTTYGVNDT